MFTRADWEQAGRSRLGDFRFGRFYPGLRYTVYPQFAFIPPNSEQHVRITRAPKQPGDVGFRFWICAETAEGESFPFSDTLISYFNDASFAQIPEVEFNNLVSERCRGIIAPPELPLVTRGGFVGALKMYSLETEFIVSLFAEYEGEFVHFFWETTA